MLESGAKDHMAHFISTHSAVFPPERPTSRSENYFTRSAVWIPDLKHPLVDRTLYSTVGRWSELQDSFEVVAEILLYNLRELCQVRIDYPFFIEELKRSARSN
jgi:hypothetical protein